MAYACPVESGIPVTVQYFGLAQRLVPAAQEQVALRAPGTVRDVLRALARRHGQQLLEALVGPDDAPLPNTLVMLDGANVLHRQGLDTPIQHDATLRVVVLPAFTGGG
jgi:molybdopterin converting factor small subunit